MEKMDITEEDAYWLLPYGRACKCAHGVDSVISQSKSDEMVLPRSEEIAMGFLIEIFTLTAANCF